MCGELHTHCATAASAAGSSPRVRGTRVVRCCSGVVLRFIPACAGNSKAKFDAAVPQAVHPRVCGELHERVRGAVLRHGSSPRVRGTPLHPSALRRVDRFIPACAGNSPRSGRRTRRTTVHPRVCGELLAGRDLRRHGDGSSPRVRGTPAHPRRARRRERFIPACAGNSTRRCASCSRKSVHPRVCGELQKAAQGESGRLRFIPACAGNSEILSLSEWPTTVHPRVCGELVLRHAMHVTSCRFIPACAGNSLITTTAAPAPPVHPRVCGELAHRIVEVRRRRRFIPACAGNSNGTLKRFRERSRFIPACAGNSRRSRFLLPARLRFIPACAGNSSLRSTGPVSSTVHPRVCGELRLRKQRSLHASGSSPRVRGTPVPAIRRRVGNRFIPACAGNSSHRPPRRHAAAVHPRVCGELVALNERRPQSERFIPACAGNSSTAPSRPTLTAVHPRVCGELIANEAVEARVAGSSPRVRGTRWNAPSPASASAVHPRVCGELVLAGEMQDARRGSSPRVRGTRVNTRTYQDS